MAGPVAGIKLDTRELDRLSTQLLPRAEQIVAGGAFAVEAQAKPLAPFETGFLRSSIQASKYKVLAWRVNVWAEYGIYQELGTYKMAAHPFIVPAVERVAPEFITNWRRLFE